MDRKLRISLVTLGLCAVAVLFAFTMIAPTARVDAQPNLEARVAALERSVAALQGPRPVHRSPGNCKSMADSLETDADRHDPATCGSKYLYFGVNSKGEGVCCTAQAD